MLVLQIYMERERSHRRTINDRPSDDTLVEFKAYTMKTQEVINLYKYFSTSIEYKMSFDKNSSALSLQAKAGILSLFSSSFWKGHKRSEVHTSTEWALMRCLTSIKRIFNTTKVCTKFFPVFVLTCENTS